jgi:hypothetical protein
MASYGIAARAEEATMIEMAHAGNDAFAQIDKTLGK